MPASGYDTANSVHNWAAGNSTLSYDANGHILKLVDTGGNRVVTYASDANGQVLVREETNSGTLGPRQLYYDFNGNRIGDVGNNGVDPSQVDYGAALKQAGAALIGASALASCASCCARSN